ncbi:GntR family transcriptional regulator [Cereibacter sphaeroides]|uniref:GntR family transcriptional regulator n=1 Tax=Cereibacter sphaeroides TaxID=1063 RepID=UPI000191CCFB|nr:GntR family transcriptional regulator [Cereibacter sphaeroides]ACM03474.1 Transcriptional regulator, GntR family [Cereibacter sphaeroides KD131]
MSAPRPLAHEAYQRIISMIFEGALKSGDLLQEAALGEVFGMSRTPVREAIKRLESEGLAVVEGRFTCVRSVTAADVEEVFFLRLELEPLAARSAVRLPPAQVDAMEERVRLLMASDPAVNDLQRQTDYEFHHLLGREFGNQAVAQTVATLHRRTCIFDHTQVPERFLRGCEEHLEILEAVRSGNADAVEAGLRAHLEHARDAVLLRMRRAAAATASASAS